ncbi:hypothetical protein GCM10010168_28690 [Actinoplanes ianthinogenes]|uniref:Lipoprotein n=1 Tax=Actinoplanes ianthinogenes TaxID=122358 RepID=A0ABM7LL60_9ACTN|nr:hypothetical protein [Actinoplanes ianthinogenes]BCJ40011.1 hypothetical protein Aiant_06680 [Actinoplanes ianthinogenes]GGR09657.1 hypothetical protein GCM10010168_28690 [Actinoplanes ianthinogenes]
MSARRLLPLVVIAALLPLTACADGTDLEHTDWVAAAGRDLNCEQGARLIGVEHRNIVGDGKDDYLVVMRCKDPKISADQLEVFEGGKKATDPPFAVLTRNWPDPETSPMIMEHGCVTFPKDQVVIHGVLAQNPDEDQKKIWTRTKDGRLVYSGASADTRTTMVTSVCFNQN